MFWVRNRSISGTKTIETLCARAPRLSEPQGQCLIKYCDEGYGWTRGPSWMRVVVDFVTASTPQGSGSLSPERVDPATRNLQPTGTD